MSIGSTIILTIVLIFAVPAIPAVVHLLRRD